MKNTLNGKKKSTLSLIARTALEYYLSDVRGAEGWLSDRMRRALAAKAVMDVMLDRYPVEEGKETPTTANAYIDALLEIEKFVDLR